MDGNGCTRGHPMLEETWGCAGAMPKLHLALESTVCALGTSILDWRLVVPSHQFGDLLLQVGSWQQPLMAEP